MTKKQKLILEKYVAEMKALPDRYSGDSEATHVMADYLLEQALTDLGFPELAEAYKALEDEVGFWYA